MGIKSKIVAGALLAQMLAGCSGFALREDYWGREFLERSLFQRGITHDELGNPDFDQREPLFGPAPEREDDSEDEADEGP